MRARAKSLGHVRVQDGTIRTVPRTAARAAAAAAARVTTAPASGAAWAGSATLRHSPVSGERRSNAQQYLGSQALITAAGAGAASLIDSDNGSVAVVANNNGSLGTVGISGNEAMGRILAGGVRDMADWVNKLYGRAFAAVYAASAKVAVHLEQPLDIDYDAKGRRVHHRTGDPVPRIWIDAAAVLLAATLLGGCATSKEKLLPHGDSTMLDIWLHGETGGNAGAARPRGNCSMRARACASR